MNKGNVKKTTTSVVFSTVVARNAPFSKYMGRKQKARGWNDEGFQVTLHLHST
jgi:hypothetical protein